MKQTGPAALVITLVLLPAPARSELVRFEITSREPFAEGKEFGDAGAYERIVGRAYFEFDPRLRTNRNVVDLDKAPKNDRGRVEVISDLFLLAPSDLSKASGAALYGVNNRGNKNALRFFNYAPGNNDPQTEQHAGDGFLMKQGFIVVWSGWDGELLPGNNRLRLGAPVATAKDGSPLTGKVRCEIVPTSDLTRTVINWAHHGSYLPTKQGLATATLTHRVRAGDSRNPIPRDRWKIHVSEVESDLPGQLPKVELQFDDGFRKGEIYELIYEAEKPRVMGVCFTTVRDLMTALRTGAGSGNPLLLDGRSVVKRTYAFGVSQSGRFLREMTYWGFNEAETGADGFAFDGIIPHVSGSGLGSFNHRFAQPTRHVTQHDHHDYPADRFPFSYSVQHDPVSKQTDGIFKRTGRSALPTVLHTQSEAEYWTRSGSLTHTDPLGTNDVWVPPNVRIYLFGGTQHGPGSYPPSKGDGQTLTNPGDYRPFLRALLMRLDASKKNGRDLPPSVFPKVREGTLVHWSQKSTRFPAIPGVRYPEIIQQPSYFDFGSRWLTQRIVDQQPPLVRGDYRVLVPKCDDDGNVLGCLLPPEVAVPIATYTGWNLRSAKAGAENELVSLRGSFIPFPVSAAERQETNDPRLSVQERYGSLKNYRRLLRDYCLWRTRQGYLLMSDVDSLVERHSERAAPLFAKIDGKD